MTTLWSPASLGAIEPPHRLAMAPMTPRPLPALRQAWVVGAAAPLHQLLNDDAVGIVPVGTVPPTGVRCLPICAFSAPLWRSA